MSCKNSYSPISPINYSPDVNSYSPLNNNNSGNNTEAYTPISPIAYSPNVESYSPPTGNTYSPIITPTNFVASPFSYSPKKKSSKVSRKKSPSSSSDSIVLKKKKNFLYKPVIYGSLLVVGVILLIFSLYVKSVSLTEYTDEEMKNMSENRKKFVDFAKDNSRGVIVYKVVGVLSLIILFSGLYGWISDE